MNTTLYSLVKIILIFTLISAAHMSLHAQEKNSIQVIDKDQKSPIPGLNYTYGESQGTSDDSGVILLAFIPNQWLYLSHLSYGSWSLSPEEVEASAQSGKIFRSELIYGLEPVSVISLKLQEEKDDQLFISDQERLHHDAGSILALNPTITGIRKGGSFAFDPVMRGFKYDQLNIVINGMQSANAACPNRMDPPTAQVALNRIKEVQILKGPHALRYGIGLGGTINYIQELPEFTTKSGTYGRLSSMLESNGNVWRNEGRIGFQGSTYDVGILGSWAKGNDYRDGNANYVASDFMRGTLGVYADLKAGSKNLLQFSVNRNFARNVDFPSLGMDLRTDDTWMGSLKHTKTFTGQKLTHWTNLAYFTHVGHLMDNLLRDMNPRMSNASTPAITQNWGARTEGEWRFKKSKLFAGLDHKQEEAEGIRTREMLMGPMTGKTFYDNLWQDSQISKTGVFANYLYPLNRMVFTISGRLDINQATANDPAEEFIRLHPESNNTQLNPGISIGSQWDLGKAFSLGLWAASVQRSGSLSERFINYLAVGLDPYELVGDPLIKPETNNEVDLTLGYEREKIGIEITLFGSYLTDYISSVKTDLKPRLATSPGVRQYINVNEALKTGAEMTFRQQISSEISHSLQLAYTYGQDVSLNTALPEIAPFDFRYKIMGHFIERKLHTGLNLRYVSAQNRISEAFGESRTPGFKLLDFDASYPINSQILIKGGIQNLLDETYYEHLSRPIGTDKIPMYSPGRNFFVMLSVKFP